MTETIQLLWKQCYIREGNVFIIKYKAKHIQTVSNLKLFNKL